MAEIPLLPFQHLDHFQIHRRTPINTVQASRSSFRDSRSITVSAENSSTITIFAPAISELWSAKTQTMHVEQRKGVTEDIGFIYFPDVEDVLCVLNQIPLVRIAPLGCPVVPEV